MANILTHVARHAKAELLAAGIEVGHAKLQEVLAALLGYHTYRALKHEEGDQELEYHLSDAEFIVLDQELGEFRAAELFELPGEVLLKCIATLEECLPAQVLPSVDAYLERHGMNAVIAALTNNPQKGFHLGPDWSSRYELSPDQRFSFHEPIWEARRSWQVHAEVSLQSNAPDAELQEINVLLTHAKAGRSGLVLKGVNPVEDITAVLDSMQVDQLVRRDDGSVGRPWVAIVVHSTSGAVLGSAVSFADTPEAVEVDALTDALDSAVHGDNDGGNGTNGYHIFQLDVDRDFTSARLANGPRRGIEIIHRSNRPNQMGGRMEAIFHKISKSMLTKQTSLRALEPIADMEIVSTEEIEQLFKKS
ncbi:hypothetical protein [Pseudomonas putida]|uniref:Uncharacterized protein n=1 Tax=Pseudomonas putida TaxID=303 RepID=A0A6I7ESQ9_PSEPU|nr:hypothetical protein [Pseudomonas putida]QHW08402.1 hypothetical protein C2H86_28585 [Pseudomonas putida]